ncbi:hypothetical protein [Streptomyces sp. NPDC001759]
MSDLSPSPREGGRSALPSADADGLSDALFRLEHPSRARRAWDRSRRMVSDGMQSLLRLLRRVFSRRTAGGGGGVGGGGYEPSPGPAGAGWQQAPDAPAAGGWERASAQGPGLQPAPGPQRPAGREMSPLDQLVQLIGELPRQQRHAFEDAVLNKVRTEGKWRRAYDRDLEKGRDSFLVRVANNAYRREVAPADRQDAARRSEAAVREQLPAYTTSASTASVPRSAFVESPGRDHWDATVAEAHLSSARSRAEAGSTTSALPQRDQDAMPTAEELRAAPDETGARSSPSEAARSPEPDRDTAVRHLDPASSLSAPPSVSPLLSPATPLTPTQLGAQYFGSEESSLSTPPSVSPLLSPVTPLTPAQLGAQYFGSEESSLSAPPSVSPLLSPATPLTPTQLGAQYFGSEESLLEGGATVPAPATGTPLHGNSLSAPATGTPLHGNSLSAPATATPPDNPLGAQATLQRPPTPSSNQRPAPTQTPSRSVPAAGNAARPATRRRG